MNLEGLNPEQRRAVEHDRGPVLVLAGAGSGKTRVITTRIARLIGDGAAPDSILGVTFTNKAAAEMRERVAHLIPPDEAKRVTLGTFHSLGARILRSEIQHLGFDRRFHILDDGDRTRVMRQVLKELNLADRREKQVLGIVSRAKNARATPASLPDARYNPEMPRAQRAFDQYNQALRNLNAVDFDDLLLLPTVIFERHPDIRQKYRERYRYVLVDEYQDTNPIQLALLQHLVGPPENNIMAVGDDDQSIYRFRGAVADNILRFGDTFEGAEMIALEQNYRSTGAVLNLANAVISRNKDRHDKTLWSELGTGRPVELREYLDEFEEADDIARIISEDAEQQRVPFDRFAILYRSNTQAATMEEALRKRSVPYRLLGGQSVFDKKEIRDVTAYLQLVLNARDELAIRRVLNFPARGIGTGTMAKLDEVARDNGHRIVEVLEDACRPGDVRASLLSDTSRAAVIAMFAALERARSALRGAPVHALGPAVRQLLEDLELERAIKGGERNPNIARIRWENVESLVERMTRLDNADTAWGALEDYVQLMALESSAASREREEELRNRVTLSTIHSSKGLEFPVVFLVGMSDDLLPHSKAAEEPGGEAEERRLCYVGITRAQQRLYMSYSRTFYDRNERRRRPISRFLADLPPGLWAGVGGPTVHELEAKREAENADRLAEARARLRGLR